MPKFSPKEQNRITKIVNDNVTQGFLELNWRASILTIKPEVRSEIGTANFKVIKEDSKYFILDKYCDVNYRTPHRVKGDKLKKILLDWISHLNEQYKNEIEFRELRNKMEAYTQNESVSDMFSDIDKEKFGQAIEQISSEMKVKNELKENDVIINKLKELQNSIDKDNDEILYKRTVRVMDDMSKIYDFFARFQVWRLIEVFN